MPSNADSVKCAGLEVMQLPGILETGTTMVNDCANGRQGD